MMDKITINEWIGIIYAHLLKKNFSDQEFSENLDQKIEQAIEEENVPIRLKNQVKDGVEGKIRKFEPNIWRVSKLKDNPNIKYCDITNMEQRHIYFDSYTNILRENKTSEKSIALLKSHSEKMIEEFPEPGKSNENYKFKGLVIGQIQSGKTANIESLVCRAVDFGYRFIIIMCGRTNALRQQNQLRFDNEVLTESDTWSKLTTDSDKDFKGGTVDLDSNLNKPKIAIIKKIPSTLKKIKEKIEKNPELKNHPCLIIDDECDDASIDTNANKEDFDPTKTNQEIRNLINCFNKIVYVGFSATPFANVFIDANNTEDLYPKDFIFLLDTPEGYTGTKDFIEKYDNFVSISDEGAQQKLKEAIYSFILSCCIIKEKKSFLPPKNNFSMLVHPSYKKNVHSKYESEVNEIVKGLKHYLEHPKYLNIKREFEDLFEKQFSFLLREVSFESIFNHYRYFVDKIETKKLNSDQAIEEDKHILKYQEQNKVYIVIGGNILARGLTLEGLLTSFFTRESKGKHQYDSLLQMQRWCGFREDYLKYIRIYTTQRLKNDLIKLVDIEEEFREYIKEKFNEEGASPVLVKPHIKSHQSMKVVSKVKEGKSFEDINVVEDYLTTLEFYFDYDKLMDNINIVKSLVKNNNDNSNFIVSVKEIENFIESYQFCNPKSKIKFQNKIKDFKNKYSEWIITIYNSKASEDSEGFRYSEKLKVNKIHRALMKKGDSLKISQLKHRLKKTEKPKLIVYTIDEKSNKKDYPRKSERNVVDKTLEAPASIVALYFQFPDQDSSSKGKYRGQPYIQ